MGSIMANITAKQWCETNGVSPDSLRMAFPKIGLSSFAQNRELTPTEIRVIEAYNFRSRKNKQVSEKRAVKAAGEKPAAPPVSERPEKAAQNSRRWAMYALLAGPTFASVENMYSVTHDLAHSWQTAVALTAVLSLSAIGFVWYGVRAWWSIALAVLLIAFESFCNLTRIYGGLMGIGESGNPTRFLGLVTDIFNSGSHQTAIALGAFTAFFIAAVQYAAVFELNRK